MIASRIHLLPDHVSNRIAAGEIIERPASVVRELLDNSIDAGAHRIDTVVRGGGLGSIEIRDDGCGIAPDDLILAFERHATSKITSADDLDTITTLGFRGEALPSIASVSRLLAESYSRDHETGARIVIDSGKRIESSTILCSPGTRIQVQQLFSNVPARKKFLKSLNTELGHIAESVIDHAIAFPAVHFTYQCEDRVSIDAPSVDRWTARIQDLFGDTFIQKLICFDDVVGDIIIRGFISDPGSLQTSAKSQRLFINHRRIRDRMITQAVYKAYQEFVSTPGHPVFILDVQMPSDRVDINVHPAKSEVRFQDSGAIFSSVVSSIRRSLGGSIFQAFPKDTPMAPLQTETVQSHGSIPFAGLTSVPMDRALPFSNPSPGLAVPHVSAQPDNAGEEPRIKADHWHIIGQMMGTYILVDADQHLIIIDQHTAHERMLFEQLKRDYSEGKIQSQGLIFPVPVEIEPNLFGILMEFSDLLRHMGVYIEDFGRNAVLVRSLPRHLSDERVDQLLRDIASDLLETGTSDRLRAAERRLLITLSCRRAVKAGDRLDITEMQKLVDLLLRGEIPSTCPHGRPIISSIHRREIEIRFKR